MSPIKNQNASRFSFPFFSHFLREMYKSTDYPPRVAGAAEEYPLENSIFVLFFFQRYAGCWVRLRARGTTIDDLARD